MLQGTYQAFIWQVQTVISSEEGRISCSAKDSRAPVCCSGQISSPEFLASGSIVHDLPHAHVLYLFAEFWLGIGQLDL